MRVEQIMTTDVATARPDTPLKEVARTLAEHSISGLPVVDAEGELVGIVSEHDLLPGSPEEPDHPGLMRRLHLRSNGTRPPARVAADVMSSPVVSIEPYWSIPGAAAIMRDNEVKRLPVVRQGRVVGIVSRADVIRAIARNDSEIQREVREVIAFHQGLWSETQPVEVIVADGETTLRGEARRRSLAESLPALVSRVAGVLNVTSELTWREDDLSS